MHSKYKDIATADVDVDFDAKNSEGEIKFRVKDVTFKDIDLSLKKSDIPLNVVYNISNKQDTIEAENSTWNFKNKFVDVEKVILPFSLDTLVANIPTTSVKIDNLASAYISGTFALNPIRTNLDVDLLKFTLSDIEMDQSSASLKVIYDEKITITPNEDIRFDANNLDYLLKETILEISEEGLKVLKGRLEVKDLADAIFNANYLFKSNSGTINLKKINFEDKELGKIFSSKDDIKLQVKSTKKSTNVKASKFDTEFILKENSWRLRFNSLENIAKKSKLLQDYNVTNGDFTLYKNPNNKNIQFFAKTKYPYKLLVVNNKPVENYIFNGEIDDKTKAISLKINNLINVDMDKEIKVTTDKIGINIDEILNYLNDRETSSKEGKNIIFNATNSYLYISKDRHIISDKINLQYFNKIVSAQLQHKEGSAGFELKDKKFYLYGDKFNDEFMNNLFALSKFKSGTLSFSMAGSTKEYDGLMQIKETTILDYKVLNNILAFVNTIPSLVTFSIPGYSKNGLEVKNAYMNFHAKDDIFYIKDVSLDSKEIDILGRGNASFKYNNIDLDLNLKTDLGSSVSKIPVVGYILLGEDTVSTSMKISGKLDDPDVKSLIAKDIAVAPLNIIKRTLLLPFQIFKDDEEDK